MKKLSAIVLVCALVIAAILYSPWITEDFAKSRAETAFEHQWKHTQDGCGFHCKGCGIKSSNKVLFGRMVEIEYACGLLPSDSPQYHQRKKQFVSFLGTVH